MQEWWQNLPGSFVLGVGRLVLAVGGGVIGFGGRVLALGRGIISAGRLFLGVCGVVLGVGRRVIEDGLAILVLSAGVLGDVAGAGSEDGAAVQRNESIERNVMKTKLKATLEDIIGRAQRTRVQMVMLESKWVSPYLPSPVEFAALIAQVQAQYVAVADAIVADGGAIGGCCGAVEKLQEASVVVATMGRIFFRGTEQAPVWQRLRATGQGQARTLAEAAQLERAWESGNAAWVPKPGLTLTAYRELLAAAEEASAECGACADALSVARGVLHAQANHLYQVCVDWYAVALAVFPADTVEGHGVWSILSPRRSRKKSEKSEAVVEETAAPVAEVVA